ncbi:MAG TPA: hypothetical protein DE179_12350 [Oceanospirillaceae bacterium]|nr:hypothetical protein [Oceanospirillaceae bacterium]
MNNDINQIVLHIETLMDDMERQIFKDAMFAAWRGSFQVKKTYVKKENADIKCDLDVRLEHWPEGVEVKLYKHKALAVLPCVKDEGLVRQYLKKEPMPCKFWRDAFYFSYRDDLDDGRYVLRDGNSMTETDAATSLNMLKTFIEEIEAILAA